LAAVIAGPAGVASAAPCSDVQVLFARGRDEPPGIGRVGTAFVNAFEPMLKGRSVSVYAVDYPAAGVGDYGVGANDMSRQLQQQAASCPQTKFVIGGYSLGAAATDLVVGVGLPGFGFDEPLPDDVGGRVAAVVTFGNAADKLVGPLNVSSPVYGSRTIDLCNGGDPICSGGDDRPAHSVYEQTQLPLQAAAFASRLI
jgi:cutinase